ncbi:hypothetical protein H632_c455p0, partial [Helicosporidium sp. ATCC 50920]
MAVNKRGQKLSCKTTRFYYNAYYTQSKKVLKDIYDKSPDIKADLYDMPTNKTAPSAILNYYVRYRLPRLNKLLRFHMDKDFRELRFRRRQGRVEALDNLCKKFIDPEGQKTIVGLGNWDKDHGDIIKGHPVGPV